MSCKRIHQRSCHRYHTLKCIDSGLVLALCICFAKRGGRPLWERPEHATGKYLIHDTSPILVDNSTSKEKEKEINLPIRTKTKRSGCTTTFSCGCHPHNISPAKYSCGCSPNEGGHQTIGNHSPSASYNIQQLALSTEKKASGDNVMAWKQVCILHL